MRELKCRAEAFFSSDVTRVLLGRPARFSRQLEDDAEAVDWVCLTGGTARVPAIRAQLAARFGEGKVHQLSGLHSGATGLAHQARPMLRASEEALSIRAAQVNPTRQP